MIGAAQRVEHYEMAGYGTDRALAELLGEDEHVSLLNQTLEEEKQADKKLTELAEEMNPKTAKGATSSAERLITAQNPRERHRAKATKPRNGRDTEALPFFFPTLGVSM